MVRTILRRDCHQHNSVRANSIVDPKTPNFLGPIPLSLYGKVKLRSVFIAQPFSVRLLPQSTRPSPRHRRVGIHDFNDLRPAQASRALRPAGSLSRPRRTLSRGFETAGCPAAPLILGHDAGLEGRIARYPIAQARMGWKAPVAQARLSK